MIYATKSAARAVCDELNRQRGYAPAYVYKCKGGFTVIRTYTGQGIYRDLSDRPMTRVFDFRPFVSA